MQYQTELLIPVLGILSGIIIPLAVFFWQYKDAKGKRETVLEISKNLEDPSRYNQINTAIGTTIPESIPNIGIKLFIIILFFYLLV